MSYFQRAVLSGVAVIALAGFSAPASAITMQAVYTGTVSSGFDVTGLFGLGANSDLSGQNFTMTFIYDPDTPGAYRVTDSTTDSVSGATNSVFTNPMLSAMITINGHSESAAGDTQGSASNAHPGGGVSQTDHQAYDFYDVGSTNVYRYITGGAVLSSLEIPLDLETAFSLDQGFGQFELRDYDYVNQQGTYFSRGTLNATHLIVSRYGDVAAVPLPAALPLLLSGFAGLGILARRRGRTKTAV